MIVNYTYGILTGGAVPKTSRWYRGTSEVPHRNKTQEKALYVLWGSSDNDSIGCGTEFILRLMQCSEYWPDYVVKYDPNNTYDTVLSLPPTITIATPVTYPKLLEWSNGIYVPTSADYRANSSDVEKIVSAFYNILTVKDGN